MKIELKKVKYYDGMSEETPAFTADLYIDGSKVGYAKNDGHGGCTLYRPYGPENVEVLKKAEEFCKALPPLKYEWGEVPMDLEAMIDDLLEKFLEERDAKNWIKKVKFYEDSCIVIGNARELEAVRFKDNVKISEIIKTPLGRHALKNTIDRVKKQMKQGYTILNTNIPADLL